ncbi:MAG: molybdopterin-dependent oxidoreductase [Desulfobacteraceae bacterium]|nr:molybdopterin-dependent oxidoreductase [Desulfobacteraceae bacterium]
MKTVTACTMDCPDACSLVVWRDAAGEIKISGNPDHPVTAGFTCAKIKRLPRRLRHPQRIVQPMIRSANRWQTIAWDEALDLCAEKIDRLRAEPAAILHFHGEGAKGVLKQANKLFFALLGASRTRGSLCDAAGFVAFLHDFGSRCNHGIADLINARRIINWGKDLAGSSVHMAAIVRKAAAAGARTLTISPGGDESRYPADHHIRIRPGTDRFLAAAVLRLLVAENQLSGHILDHTRRWPSFRNAIFKYPPEELAARCDVPPADIRRLGEAYLDGPAATIVGGGLQRYRYGGENVRFINALALLSGNIGRAGGGVYFHHHSLANLNYDWSRVTDQKARRALPMPTIGRSILEAKDPPLRMIWINGSNVVNQAPDSTGLVAAFDRIEFKVVVDAFMTDTAQQADLFLPSALMLEQEDIIGSYLTEYIHYVTPVLEPPGEARSDFWILTELGKRLTPPIRLPDMDSCFQAALRHPALNVTLAELRRRKFAKARRPAVPYLDLIFDHPDQKYWLPPELHDEPPPPPDYPLRLLSLIRKDAIHSQLAAEDQQIPLDVWVSPRCPSLKELDLDKDLWLVSSVGRLRVRLKTLADLHPETVLARRGTWMKLGGGLNRLIAAQLTDIGNGAPFYAQYVRLENGARAVKKQASQPVHWD